MLNEAQRFRKGVWFSVAFVLLLWSVEALEQALAIDLRDLGILPRTLKGTLGILTGPLVHGDVMHLISNTFPLLVLGIGIFYFYNSIALEVIFIVYFLTGFWVWMMARQAYHIGASGIVYGLLAFLFFSGLLRKDRKTLAVSLILLFIYGANMIYGVFPINEGISWESHMLGGLSGLFCAIFFRRVSSSLEPAPEAEEIPAVEPPAVKEVSFRFYPTNPNTFNYSITSGPPKAGKKQPAKKIAYKVFRQDLT